MNDFAESKAPAAIYSYKSRSDRKKTFEFFSNEEKVCAGLLAEPDFSGFRLNETRSSHRLLSGFYPIENDSFRWMAKEGQLLLDIPASARQLHVRGYCPEGVFRAWPLTLSLFVEDQLLGTIELPGGGNFARELELCHLARPRRLVAITLVSSHSFVPADLRSSSSDRRELSIQLHEVGFHDGTNRKAENNRTERDDRESTQPYHPYFKGTCLVCGEQATFVLTKLTLTRESLVCTRCGASNRIRQLSRGLLKFLRGRGFNAQTVAELAEGLTNDDIVLYDTDSSYSIARLLRSKKQYLTSDYLPTVQLGSELGERHSCQDLSRLTFANASFDVVLTSDVFEHVRLYDEAFREIHRVLKPGGALIFTVPFDGSVHAHHIFVDVVDPAKPEKDSYVREPVFHGDPLRSSGALLYRVYGTRLFEELEAAGFLVNYERSTYPHLGIFDCDLFSCLKPEPIQIHAAPSDSLVTANPHRTGASIVAARRPDHRDCRWLNIELSSICNLRCRWCVLDHQKPRQFLSLDLLEEVLRQIVAGELPDVERIDLHNGGEALLHPHVDEALQLFGKYRPGFKHPIHVALLTNGTVLEESTLLLLTSGRVIDEIRVSVDGGTVENFEYIRKGAKWPIVSANVRRIAEGLRNAGTATKLGIICMVPPGKPPDASWMDQVFRGTLSLAHSVEFRHPHSWEGMLQSAEIAPADVSRKDKTELCKFLKHNLVVLASGNVTVCCADLNGRGTVGTLGDRKLADILTGPERESMIALWQQGRFNEMPLCSTCEGYPDPEEVVKGEDDLRNSNGQTVMAGGIVADAEFEKAHALLASGQIDEAASALRDVLRTLPGHSLALNDLGVIAFQNGEFDNAQRYFQRALDCDPENISAGKNLAECLTATGDAEAGTELWQRILAQHPDDMDAMFAMADMCIAGNRRKPALFFLRRVLEIDPHNVDACQRLEACGEEIGEPLEAHNPRSHVSKATMTQPQRLEADAVPPHVEDHLCSVPDVELTKISHVEEFQAYARRHAPTFAARRHDEMRLLKTGESFGVHGVCYVCKKEVDFLVDYQFGATVHDGLRIPNWRERLVCPHCQLNNRVRASIQLFEQLFRPKHDAKIYIAEQRTPFYSWLNRNYAHVVGSEFLGESIPFGETNREGIRNETLTALTFQDSSFDYILAFEVFEHIPDTQQVIAECLRVLTPGGRLLFTVPFANNSHTTLVRAKVLSDGSIQHLLPPEHHGDPNSSDGCLCFYTFGWELMDQFVAAGFHTADARMFWSRQLGYLGGEHTLFIAEKPGVQMCTPGEDRQPPLRNRARMTADDRSLTTHGTSELTSLLCENVRERQEAPMPKIAVADHKRCSS